MNRTPASYARRRNIADAVSGFPERTRVILYASLPEGTDREPIINDLRAYAKAKDFVVPDEAVIVDIGFVGRSRRERPGWFQASKLLRENMAEGVITPNRLHIANTPGEQGEFDAWLASLVKFINYADASDEDVHADDDTRADA
ncbi:hypothetical protein [Streptomyces sp. NPDC058861]|uniref:hypothetical protein n=1 Tax=Streptomyces sp. NPDC058861 TaxID=3346653 RepID=UPI0036882744